jgi:hypothetical protein
VRRIRPLTALLAALLAALAVALGACGGSGGSGADAGADPAKLAPATSGLYAEITVRPEGDQKANAEAVLGKILGTSDPSEKLIGLFDKSAADHGVTFKRDVDPWLGNRLGVVFTNLAGKDPDVAVVAPATDSDAARAALRKGSKTEQRTYKDVEYDFETSKAEASGIVDGYAVAGDEPAFKAVVDTSKSGNALADADRYRNALDGVPADHLGLLYADPQAIVQASRLGPLEAGIAKRVLDALKAEPVVADLTAEPAALAVELRTKAGGLLGSLAGNTTPLLGALPGDSWLAFGIGDLGAAAKRLLGLVGNLGIPGLTPDTLRRQLRAQAGIDLDRDLLDWMGDAAVFVRGTSARSLGGGVVLESKDPAASRRAVTKLGVLIARESRGSGTSVSGSAGNLTIRDRGTPQPIRLVARGNRVVAAYGNAALRAALAGGGRLKDASRFLAASKTLGPGIEPSGFVSIPEILRLAESMGASSDSGYQQAKPYLAALASAVFGSRTEGDRVLQRFVLGVR